MEFRVVRLRGRWQAPRLGRLLAGLAGLALIAATLGPAGARVAGASARTTSCMSALAKVGRSLGPTYVERLTVAGTSCAGGETLVRAYNRCRIDSGGLKGRCSATVDGYRCRETRQGSPDQFLAAVSCTRARDAVHFTYSENT